jgi:NAD(P)-dependent dehydrogenase (short-subunit alcohol dehydrogenase family)
MSEPLALPELLDLSGRRAVVTGAAMGIGAAIAARLAEAGAVAILADIDEEGAATVAEQLRARGLSAESMRCDVTDSAQISAVADHAARAGQLDIWVNNAGIYPTTGPVLEVTDTFLDRMFEVNIRSQYSAAREAARRMTGGGSIVNLASVAGIRGGRGITAYSTSKAAVIGMTRALSHELGALGVRINAIAPGVIDTPGVREQMGPLRAAGLDIDAVIASNPLGIGGQPDDIAKAALFLASPLSSFVTGHTLVVDGGYTA